MSPVQTLPHEFLRGVLRKATARNDWELPARDVSNAGHQIAGICGGRRNERKTRTPRVRKPQQPLVRLNWHTRREHTLALARARHVRGAKWPPAATKRAALHNERRRRDRRRRTPAATREGPPRWRRKVEPATSRKTENWRDTQPDQKHGRRTSNPLTTVLRMITALCAQVFFFSPYFLELFFITLHASRRRLSYGMIRVLFSLTRSRSSPHARPRAPLGPLNRRAGDISQGRLNNSRRNLDSVRTP